MASSTDEALRLKSQGNDEYKAGNYSAAEALYTQAMDMDPANPTFMTNRASARLQLSNFKGAVSDCDAALATDDTLAKAWSLKGTALHRMGRVEDAIAAYSTGLKHHPQHATLQANLSALRTTTAGTGPAASAPSPAPAVAAPATSLSAYLYAGPGSAQNTVHNVLRAIALVCAVLYLLPGSPGRTYFNRSLQAALGCQMLGLFRTHGRPQFSMQYAAHVLPNRMTFVAFMCVIFMTMGPPMLLVFVPVLGVELFCFGEFVYGAALATSAVAGSMIAKLGGAVIPNLSPDFQTLPYANKRTLVYDAVLRFSATMEVYVGFLLVLSMNLLPAIVYFQVMKIRYLTAPECKAAWRDIDGKVLGLTSSPKCPGVITVVYNKLRGWVIWMGEPPAQPAAGGSGGGGGGLMSKCVVM